MNNIYPDSFNKAIRVTSSGLVTIGNAHVATMHIAANGGNADAQIINGVNDSGEALFDLECLSGIASSYNLSEHIRFDKGVYVKFGSNVKSVTIGFHSPNYKRIKE